MWAFLYMYECILLSSTYPKHSIAQHRTAQHGTAQHSTAQHSTAQHSTAQHSTAQHSTAQHAAISPHKPPITYVPIRARRRNQIELARASMFSSIYNPLRFQNKRRHRNLFGLQKIQPLTKQPSWCDARDLSLFPISVRYNTAPLFISYYTSMPRPGCFPGARSSWHLQVVSLHLNELRIIFCVLSCGRA